ncbi:hypothetical protein TYRP_002499, partial [Tyrophagus putrescentiae]
MTATRSPEGQSINTKLSYMKFLTIFVEYIFHAHPCHPKIKIRKSSKKCAVSRLKSEKFFELYECSLFQTISSKPYTNCCNCCHHHSPVTKLQMGKSSKSSRVEDETTSSTEESPKKSSNLSLTSSSSSEKKIKSKRKIKSKSKSKRKIKTKSKSNSNSKKVRSKTKTKTKSPSVKIIAKPSSRTYRPVVLHRRSASPTAAIQRGRKCTDVSCCVLFVLCMAVWISIGVAFATYLFMNHGLSFGLAPLDSLGNRCGHGNFSTRPYLFFFNIADCINAQLLLFGVIGCGADGSAQVCVDHCPNVTFSVYDQITKREKDVAAKEKKVDDSWLERMICKYHVGVPTPQNVEELWKRGNCAAYYIESEPILNRCIPKVIRFTEDEKAVDEMQKEVMQLNVSGMAALTLNTAEQVTDGLNRLLVVSLLTRNLLEDLVLSWKLILLVIGIGVLLSLVWLYGLAYYTRPVIWASLIALIGITAYLVYFSATQYSSYFAGGLLRSTTLWLVMTVASSVLLLFLLCGAALLSDRINLAICLIEETSTALAALRLLVVLFLPLVPYLFQLTATALWVAISLSLFAARRPTYLNERFVECVPSFAGDEVAAAGGGGGNQSAVVDKDGNCQLRSPLSGPSLLLCQLFSFFCYQWLFYFLEALYIISLAGCFSTFYWQPPKSKKHASKGLPQFISLHSVQMAFRYHLGTLAFGAFFVALLRTVRLLLDFVHARLKAALNPSPAPDGQAAAAAAATSSSSSALSSLCGCCTGLLTSIFTSAPILFRLAQWLLALTDRLLSFLNHHTYLMTAIYGRPFCASAVEALTLLATNPLRSIVLYATSHYLLTLVRLAITGSTAFVAFFLFVVGGDDPLLFPVPLHYRWAPVVAASAVTYLVSALYIDIYEVGLDTMFLCFLLDDKLHDGSRRRPFFMPNATRQRLLQLDVEVQRRSHQSDGDRRRGGSTFTS